MLSGIANKRGVSLPGTGDAEMPAYLGFAREAAVGQPHILWY